MIQAIKRFFCWLNAAIEESRKLSEENRRREEERKQMIRDNIEAWKELNHDFVEELDKEIDREIDERYDISKTPYPDAYNFDGSPLRR